MRKAMMGLVRTGKAKVSGSGFTVTWDIDSRDRTAVNRVAFYLFGRTTRDGAQTRVYLGFVHKEGVRYLGQSTLFVLPHRLHEIRSFLAKVGADNDISPSTYL